MECDDSTCTIESCEAGCSITCGEGSTCQIGTCEGAGCQIDGTATDASAASSLVIEECVGGHCTLLCEAGSTCTIGACAGGDCTISCAEGAICNCSATGCTVISP